MINAIGLGKAGREIVHQLNQEIFHSISIDCDMGSFLIDEQKSFEDYENKFSEERISELKMSKKSDSTFFFLAGGGDISGSCLRILEHLKESQKLFVHYIRPDLDLLSSQEKLKERSIYRVLQEFARSGLIEQLVLFSNQVIDELLGGNGIGNYYSEINNTIVNTIEMVQFLENEPSLLGNLTDPEEISRIASLGIMTEDNKEKSLFNIVNAREKQFIFALPESTLQTHKTLLKEIKDLGTMVESGTRISYKVISTDYDKKYVYVKNFTNIIQE